MSSAAGRVSDLANPSPHHLRATRVFRRGEYSIHPDSTSQPHPRRHTARPRHTPPTPGGATRQAAPATAAARAPNDRAAPHANARTHGA